MIDVVIVGGGFAGSMAAILLDRLGANVTVIDRYAQFPAFFAAEQLVGKQIDFLAAVGLLENLIAGVPLVSRVATYSHRRRHKMAYIPHYGLSYQRMIEGLRSQFPASIKRVVGRVTQVAYPVVQTDTATFHADLIIMATGPNNHLLRQLDIPHRMISDAHSMAIGFDLISQTAVEQLISVFYGARDNRIDYLTVFPFEGGLRGNLFVYCQDDWTRAFKRNPYALLNAGLPMARPSLGAFDIDNIQARSISVSVADNYRRDGILLLGDAFQTPCPAAGTGIDRMIVELSRLIVHFPIWRAQNDFSQRAIARFYDDEVKQTADAKALHDAHYRRHLSTSAALLWRLHRQKVSWTRRFNDVFPPSRNYGCISRVSGVRPRQV